MNCSICRDILVDTSFSRCEWCRLGAPMEAALEGPSSHAGRSRGMSGLITDRLKELMNQRRFLPVQQLDPLHDIYPLYLDTAGKVTKVANALPSALGPPREYLGQDKTSTEKYGQGWDAMFGKKK